MSHEKYLENEILAAPKQKLQLLLIDAALRHGHRAKKSWEQHDTAEARLAIEKMQAIALQLLNGISPDRSQPLARQAARIYAFIVRRLATAHLEHDRQALDDAMRLLQIERDTWCEVCRQMAQSPKTATVGSPHLAQFLDPSAASRLCLDA